MAKKRYEMSNQEETSSVLGAGLKGLAGFSISAVAAASTAWILYSKLGINHHVTAGDAIPAERKTFTSRGAGVLSYYLNRGRTGRPLVLIHSINAAASAYEMRPLFLQYHTKRPVFALDLPGFGFSERTNRVYAPGLYEAAIRDFLEMEVGEPADVVALSLGCEFAARAALALPERFNSLVLISPTGFGQRSGERGSQKAARGQLSDIIHPVFAFPLWARAFYDLISTRTSIVYFLRQSFMGPVPDDLVEYAYATAHQPGAEHAPLYFISGKLFTPNIRRAVYEHLQVPTLVLYDRDAFTGFEMLPDLLAKNASWQAVRMVPTLGLPHFERPEDTVEVLDRFWQ
jgi:pimeloyl-ACP methyl ester carboxylesterase